MTQYPVKVEVQRTEHGTQVKASTAVERALEGGARLQTELRCIELDYRTALAGIREALGAAGKGRFNDPLAYWTAGRILSEFMRRLETRGFYLIGKNTTPAEHLGISKTSVVKMIAFHHRYPDPTRIDPTVPWGVYRDNREGQPA